MVSDLLTVGDAHKLAAEDTGLAKLLAWVESFPMNPHPDLGRSGAVCPFARTASKYDMLRLRVSECGPDDEAHAFRLMCGSYADLESIPANADTEKYRAVIVGFPNCVSEDGVAMLQRVQKRHKYRAVLKRRMLGYMYPGAQAPGLWNKEFRPLAAPMPVIVVRNFVEQDSLFVAGQKLQWPPYLLLFGIGGAQRLLSRRRAS
ncbi:MAG: hypothetical protein GC155_03310 [Alphaproteobacteria bacterium]|nr:hypothetical protein [Alphaproteobacteria bacterium]